MEPTRTPLGAYLHELRTAVRVDRRILSQGGLVARCALPGITQTTVSHFEIGDRLPSVVQLEAILTALGAGDAERARALRLAGVRAAA